jgi:ABC-type multidrug transport system fused ATPase/permease subunit
MDSEKNTHMRELLEAGRPVTDEGPFYHHAFWESYKGSVKGQLGGGLLGAGIGVATGLVAAGIVTTAAVTFPALAIPAMTLTGVGVTVAGFSAAGMLYGVHKFEDVGKIAGAQAATAKIAEKRLKPYIDAKVDEVKEEISELKSIVKGEPVVEKSAAAKTAALEAEQEDYRTEHFQGQKVPDANKYVFWKIAAVGLAIGLIAGALLASGGIAGEVLNALGFAGGELGMGAAAGHGAARGAVTVGEYIASMTAMGAIGASFGVNRDIFRQIFDKTDMWFRGFVSHEHSKDVLLGKGQTIENMPETAKEIEMAPARQTVVYTGQPYYPESTTHFQDKYLAGKEILASMDHTKMSPH